MSFFYRHISLLLPFFISVSCCFCDEEKKADVAEKPVLTFAVAGHVYGIPGTTTVNLYSPFLKKIKHDNAVWNFDYLFLTGDVVARSTDSNWNIVTKELDSMEIAWLIAPGNHDLGSGSVPLSSKMQKDYGTGGPYYHIRERENHFLILNTSNPGWTLDSAQIKFFENSLTGLKTSSTIFVFSHQLWWQKNTPKEFELDSVRSNSFACFDGESDFWKDAFPLFDSLKNQIYFFAGDLGSHHLLESYYEDHYKNYHFYGSGMGGGTEDNYLIVSVYKNGDVKIERVDF